MLCPNYTVGHKKMTEITKIIITSSLTVFTGIIIFIGGQILLKFIVEPLQNLRKELSKIQHALIFFAQSIHTPRGHRAKEDAASDSLRNLSCDLRIAIEGVPFYAFWRKFWRTMPDRKSGLQAASHLIGLSNSVHIEDRTNNYNIVKKIRSLLNLEEIE